MDWKHALQLFELDYEHGFLFWDRAGVVARRLCDQFPQLLLKDSGPEQKNFVTGDGGLDLFYGVRVASVQRLGDQTPVFSEMATGLHKILVQDLVLRTLTGFRMRHVVARPLSGLEEARRTLFAFTPGIQTELTAVAPTAEPLAFQIEMLSSKSVRVTVRLSTARLSATSGSKPTGEAQDTVLHLVVALLTEGIEPMKADKLEVEKLLRDNAEVLFKQIIPAIEKHVAAT